MSVPATRVQIAFDLAAAGNGNFFTLDDTAKGVLDGATYKLAGDVLVDVTSAVRSVSITRGRNRELDRFDAGMASIVLDNRNRWFDPTAGTAVSPYAGSILPRKEVRIDVAESLQFVGQVEDWNLDYTVEGDSTAVAVSSDAFALLSGQTLGSATMTSEYPGARIETILSDSDVLWPVGRRDIDTGTMLLQGDTIDDGTNALEYLQLVEQTEFGALFVSRDGNVTFRERSANQTPRDDVAFADDGASDAVPFVEIAIDYGTEQLYNQATVTRINGGTAIANNTTSQDTYGISQVSTSGLYEYDSQAQDVADFLVGRYGDPELRINSVTVVLNDLSPSQQAKVLDLELYEQMFVRFTPNGVGDPIERSVTIDNISHEISPGEYRVQFSFSQTLSAFVLDSSLYGILDSNILGF